VLSDCRHVVTLTDALQIHTVELAKYNFDSASISEADALTQWAFLLDRSADMEAAELKRLLPGPEFHKAIEIMETIARTPEERQLYEARRQAELDYRAGLDEAHARGWQEGERLGLEKGERLGLEKGRSEGRQEAERAVLVDQIRFLQDVLGGPVSSESELSALDLAVLRQTCAELRDRVQSQR
jgi:flagellar biosynthesis/type III secretory pathway protein FliH